MTEITLGLDIGTQFCYAGYWDRSKGRFVQAIVPDNAHSYDAEEVRANGIPTMFAYNVGRGSYVWGSEAARKIAEGQRGWITDETSIKERVREQMQEGRPDAKFVLDECTEKQHDLMDMFRQLVCYIAEEVRSCLNSRFTGGWKIKEVVFAYPDVTDQARGVEEYKARLADIIRDAFRFGGEHPVVDSRSEGQIVAACLAKNSTENRHFCTVDVGAGTTDVVLMKRAAADHYVQDGTSYSCTFGGKRIDEQLHNCGVCRTAMHAQGMLDNKKWLFTGEGEPASGLSASDRASYMGQVVNRAQSLIVWTELCKRLRTYYLPKVDRNTTVILLGGSSVVPFVQNKVKEIFSGAAEVATLKEWAAGCRMSDITNSNFVAYAAAVLRITGGTDIDVCQRQTLAIRDTNQDYYILADATTACNGFRYYLTPTPWREVEFSGGNVSQTFDPTTSLYVLHLREGVELNGKDKIRAGEAGYYVESVETYTGYVGVKKKLPHFKGGEEVRYYYGTVMSNAFEQNGWGSLHLYLFDNTAAHTCHYDALEQKPYTYAAFKNMADRCTAGEKITEDPGLHTSNKTTGNYAPSGTNTPDTSTNRPAGNTYGTGYGGTSTTSGQASSSNYPQYGTPSPKPAQRSGRMLLCILALVMGLLWTALGAAFSAVLLGIGMVMLVPAVATVLYQLASHGAPKNWFPTKK